MSVEILERDVLIDNAKLTVRNGMEKLGANNAL